MKTVLVGSRYTYQLIPSVGAKVVFPKERDVGISFCRLLLHDTMLNDDSFRCGTSVTPVCDCGSDRESAEHFLFYCSKYAEARRVMFDNIKDIWFTSKLKGQCMITESLLLADPQVNSISKSVNRNIKEQLFEYLASVDRRL